MFSPPVKYDKPLFRPLAEAYSLIFQVTVGCSWNKCSFCEMYTMKKFKTKNFDEVKSEIEENGFILSGNPLIFPG